MKIWSLFILILISDKYFCQSDSINLIFVDLKENSNAKIIHYVNGKYAIKQTESFKSKKINALTYFEFVNPRLLVDQYSALKISSYRDKFISDKFYEELNSKNISEWSLNAELSSVYYFPDYNNLTLNQKDSLRKFYRINVDSTVYSQEVYDPSRQKYVTKNYVKYKLDSLDYRKYEFAAKKHRDSLNPFVNELLTPFYISRYEVTNGQYRKFVNWVLDSLALRMLYDSLPNQEAVLLLKTPKKTKLNQNLKLENLAKYGLNYELNPFEMQNDDSLIQFYLSSFYFKQPERYYQRQEKDSRKIIYRYNDNEISVYPDTLSYNKGFDDSSSYFYHPESNLYFWHPGYDNYPVMGLNIMQIEAYCHWLENQMNKIYANSGIEFALKLPTTFHYEMAIKQCLPSFYRNEIDINSPTPVFYQRNDESAVNFIRPVNFSPENFLEKDNKFYFELNDWYSSHSTFPIQNLINNVAEIVQETDSTGLSHYYQLGSDLKNIFVDSNGNKYNSLFHKRKVVEENTILFTGFRPIISLKRK